VTILLLREIDREHKWSGLSWLSNDICGSDDESWGFLNRKYFEHFKTQ
jgi:hypothetical protein